MYKKGDFVSYFFGVVVGISVALLLTLKLWGNSWWQIAISCVVGVVVGLFVADWRGMVKLISKSFHSVISLRFSKKSLKDVWLKEVKKIIFIFLPLVYSICAISIVMFGAYFLSKNIFHVPVSSLTHETLFTGMFTIVWFYFFVSFTIPAGKYKKDYGKYGEVLMASLRLMIFLPLFSLRCIFFALVYAVMTVLFLFLFVLYCCGLVWEEKKLLFAGACIVFGAIIGTIFHSYFYGILSGGSLFSLTYFVDRVGLSKKIGATTPYFWAKKLWWAIPMFEAEPK